jgi:hypothetical protein
MTHELNADCSAVSKMILLFMILLYMWRLFADARGDAGAPDPV